MTIGLGELYVIGTFLGMFPRSDRSKTDEVDLRENWRRNRVSEFIYS